MGKLKNDQGIYLHRTSKRAHVSKIVVITHIDEIFLYATPDRRPAGSYYLLFDILMELARRGHTVKVERGIPDAWSPADAAVLHLDRTYVPQPYLNYAQFFPLCLNANVQDISKKTISGANIKADEEWHGKVIVKSNYNAFGAPEAQMNGRAQKRGTESPFPGVRPIENYLVYDSIAEVPAETAANSDLVIEKFLPELEPDGYATRFWVFCGDQERCNRYVAAEPIVKAGNALRHEPCPVPQELRELRRKMGFDFGKFDFVMHEGKAILLDANKTPGRPPRESNFVGDDVIRFTNGFETMLRSRSV